MRVFDSDAWQHAYELIAADTSDHVVGAQAASQGVGDGDEQRVARSVTSGVVRGFEPVYVDVSSYELSAEALGSIDLPHDGSQPGAAAAHSCQLIGPGVLTVLGGLRAIFRCNLAVVAALCAIVRCNLAVVDGPYAAVRGVSSFRGGPGSSVLRALTVARRAIPCSSIGLTGRVVTRFGLSVTQPCRDVTVPRGQPSLATAHGCQLVSPRILAVLRRLCAIVRRNFAVVDGSHAAIRSIGAPRVGSRAFVCRAPAIARRAIPRGSVELTGRVVARFGVSVTLLGREVTRPRSQSQSLAILGGLCAIFSCKPAVVDRLGAVIRGLGAPRGGLSTIVRRMLTVGRRAIPCGSIKIARRVVTRFGFSVAQPGRDVTVLRSQAGLPTAHSSQLVGSGIFAVLCGLGAIFGRNLAVVDGLGPVIRSLGVPRGRSGTFACLLITPVRRAIPCGSVEVTRRVVTRLGLSITLLGLSVTHVRSQIAVAPFQVALACLCQGVLAFIRPTAVLTWECVAARPYFGHMSRSCR